jgi:hypothetical protein
MHVNLRVENLQYLDKGEILLVASVLRECLEKQYPNTERMQILNRVTPDKTLPVIRKIFGQYIKLLKTQITKEILTEEDFLNTLGPLLFKARDLYHVLVGNLTEVEERLKNSVHVDVSSLDFSDYPYLQEVVEQLNNWKEFARGNRIDPRDLQDLKDISGNDWSTLQQQFFHLGFLSQDGVEIKGELAQRLLTYLWVFDAKKTEKFTAGYLYPAIVELQPRLETTFIRTSSGSLREAKRPVYSSGRRALTIGGKIVQQPIEPVPEYSHFGDGDDGINPEKVLSWDWGLNYSKSQMQVQNLGSDELNKRQSQEKHRKVPHKQSVKVRKSWRTGLLNPEIDLSTAYAVELPGRYKLRKSTGVVWLGPFRLKIDFKTTNILLEKKDDEEVWQIFKIIGKVSDYEKMPASVGYTFRIDLDYNLPLFQTLEPETSDSLSLLTACEYGISKIFDEQSNAAQRRVHSFHVPLLDAVQTMKRLKFYYTKDEWKSIKIKARTYVFKTNLLDLPFYVQSAVKFLQSWSKAEVDALKGAQAKRIRGLLTEANASVMAFYMQTVSPSLLERPQSREGQYLYQIHRDKVAANRKKNRKEMHGQSAQQRCVREAKNKKSNSKGRS